MPSVLYEKPATGLATVTHSSGGRFGVMHVEPKRYAACLNGIGGFRRISPEEVEATRRKAYHYAF